MIRYVFGAEQVRWGTGIPDSEVDGQVSVVHSHAMPIIIITRVLYERHIYDVAYIIYVYQYLYFNI